MSIFRTFVVAGALSLSASIAGAASYMTDDSNPCGLSDITPGADSCWGLADGNANAQQVDVNNDSFDNIVGLFGYSDWVVFDGDGDFGGGASGGFNISDNDYGQVAVLLKSANTFGAYLFGGGLSGDVDYDTANERGLSNYVVAGRGDSVPEVPLPASALLLLGGLGGLVVLRRRKTQA